MMHHCFPETTVLGWSRQHHPAAPQGTGSLQLLKPQGNGKSPQGAKSREPGQCGYAIGVLEHR